MLDKRDTILKVNKPQDNNLSIFDLVDAPLSWESEWWGMPEFVMGNTEPKRKITISFANDEDVNEFAKRLGVKLSSKTDSMWFPNQDEYIAPRSLRWVEDAK
jgi:hypothetical protein